MNDNVMCWKRAIMEVMYAVAKMGVISLISKGVCVVLTKDECYND